MRWDVCMMNQLTTIWLVKIPMECIHWYSAWHKWYFHFGCLYTLLFWIFSFFFQIYFDREISNVFSMTLSLFNFICLREIYWRSLTVFRKWPKKGNFLFSYRLKRLFQKEDSTWNVSINCFLEDFHVKNALTFFEEEKKKKERKTK